MKKILIQLLKKQIEVFLIAILHAYKLKLTEKVTDKPSLQIAINLIDEKQLVKEIIENI